MLLLPFYFNEFAPFSALKPNERYMGSDWIAMAKFLSLLRGKQPTKGMYSGVIRYNPLWGACDEGVCDFIDFFRLERQD